MEEKSLYTAHNQQGTLLNGNELYCNLPDSIREAIFARLQQLDFNRYPDDTCRKARELYAKYAGVEADNLIMGSGSDQMLALVISLLAGPGKTIYTLDPDFGMYDYYAASYGAKLKKYACREGFDLEEFIEQGQGADLILFSNPNNPTGQMLNRTEIETILDAFPDIPVVVDEAYVEFADEPSLIQQVENRDNLYVTRTLSKALGLAGLRAGFLAGPKAAIAKLSPQKIVYAVSSFTQLAAEEVLKQSELFVPLVEDIKARREEVFKELQGMKSLEVRPSQANFLLLHTPEKEELVSRFEKAGIQIRDFKGKNDCRITIGSPAETERVLTLLRQFEKDYASC